MNLCARITAAVLLLLAGAGPAVAGLGICVFVEGEGVSAAPASGRELRLETQARLARDFAESGWPLADEQRLHEHLARWRIRDADTLSPGFLRALRDEGDVSQLLIGRLRLFESELVLTCRLVEVRGGRLVAAEIVSGPLPAAGEGTPADWWRVLAASTREVARRCTDRVPSPGAAGLIVLPVRSIGLGDAPSSLLSDALLRQLTLSGDWWIPDPALVTAWLRGEGSLPISMSSELRRRLGERVNGGRLLRCELIGYSRVGSSRTARFMARDDGTGARAIGDELHGLLHLVNTETGLIESFVRADLPALPARGLFGRRFELDEVARIESLAELLVAGLNDSNSNAMNKE